MPKAITVARIVGPQAGAGPEPILVASYSPEISTAGMASRNE